MGGGEAVTNASKALRKMVGDVCDPIKKALEYNKLNNDIGMYDYSNEILLYIITREKNYSL